MAIKSISGTIVLFQETLDYCSLHHSTMKIATEHKHRALTLSVWCTLSAMGMLAANCPNYKSI